MKKGRTIGLVRPMVRSIDNMERNMLAIDLGGSSGRIVLGTYDGEKLHTTLLHQFSNDPVILKETMYWDLPRIFYEIKQGIGKAKSLADIDSIGIDSWGVDFGFLDHTGNMIGLPVHYRDKRTDHVFADHLKMNKVDLYERTGIPNMKINTLFQLLSIPKDSYLWREASVMLMIPDLLNYFLTGVVSTETSIASTTQLMNVHSKQWDQKIITQFQLPEQILPKIVRTGTVIGKLSEQLQAELGISACKVVAVAEHDTQSAIAAIPSLEEDVMFISCGTWSLMGTQLCSPILTKQAQCLQLSNETGLDRKTSFLKNIVGLWILQECKRQWEREGYHYSYSDLEELASTQISFSSLIDLNDDRWMSSGNMPNRIKEFCCQSHQKVPDSIGSIVRCINESLAMNYKESFNAIRACTGKNYQRIHLLGGGSQSGLLAQMCADACGVEVCCGPVEATIMGNLLIQLRAEGMIQGQKEAQELIRRSEAIKFYQPTQTRVWQEAYGRFQTMIKKG